MKMMSKVPEWFARTRIGRAVLTDEEHTQRLHAERDQAVARLADLNAPDDADLDQRGERAIEIINTNRDAYHAFRRAAGERRAVNWIREQCAQRRAREVRTTEEMLRRTCDPRLVQLRAVVGDASHHQVHHHGAGPSREYVRVVAEWEGKKLEEASHAFRDTVRTARSHVEKWETCERPYFDALDRLRERIDAEQLAASPDWGALAALVEGIPPAPCVCAPPRVNLPSDDAGVSEELLRAMTPGAA